MSIRDFNRGLDDAVEGESRRSDHPDYLEGYAYGEPYGSPYEPYPEQPYPEQPYPDPPDPDSPEPSVEELEEEVEKNDATGMQEASRTDIEMALNSPGKTGAGIIGAGGDAGV